MSERGVTVDPVLVRLTDERVGSGRSPAAVLASSRGAVPLSVGGSGDCGDDSAPDIDTVFRIASCTKSFTAARALQLRDAGLLDLDRPIAEMLPRPPRFLIPGGDAPPPTPRLLLTMSAGLPTDDAWADRLESLPSTEFDALLSRGIRFTRPPGVAYEYANLGWAILGRALEHLDGRRLQDQIEQELLDPLGLSGVRFSPPEGRRVAVGYARHDGSWRAEAVTSPGAFSAIGGLFASCADILVWARWLASAFADSPRTPDPVLSAASRREMQQLHRAIPGGDGAVSRGYGYGLIVEQSAEQGHVVSHSGGYPGFSAHMRWSAHHAITVCGFENAGYSGVHEIVRPAFDSAVADAIAAARSTPSPEPWNETREAVTRISELVSDHGNMTLWDRAGRDLFDGCMDLDMSIPERKTRLTRLIADVGAPLIHGPASFPTAARATWRAFGSSGAFDISVQLTPSEPPLIQRWDLAMITAEDARVS
ncbi:serine hydrolase domain-containing protein [Microbacterium saperdae]